MLHLRVAVYDDAAAASEVQFAEDIGAERFARAGIAIDWIDCTAATSDAYINILNTR